ncbi:hypothetical protein KDD17_02335 [Sulfitobacter albidus]|uniref:CBU-0592-like domain-containing protein n=1 Tax=Sulfitobacter albidus TaxID=2829501 RepID=A0A975JEB6_9RHOB|nr:hypothetical protein [Sulfitobacter albidus]QUJ76919.1 hypothetical protein KDD17_02335 [Sulfitobacter albidus]
MTFDFLSPALADAIGLLGFALYVGNYALLTLHILCSRSTAYFTINLTAASAVLIGLTSNFNLPAALIQTFFIVISCVGIVIRLRRPASGRLPV